MPSTRQAFTLLEVVVSVCVAGLVMASIIAGYTVSTHKVEWAACSVAAQTVADRKLELILASPYTTAFDGLAEGTSSDPEILPLPVQGTNFFLSTTNFISITSIPGSLPTLKMISVQCVWCFGIPPTSFTNTAAVIRAPNI